MQGNDLDTLTSSSKAVTFLAMLKLLPNIPQVSPPHSALRDKTEGMRVSCLRR